MIFLLSSHEFFLELFYGILIGSQSIEINGHAVLIVFIGGDGLFQFLFYFLEFFVLVLEFSVFLF
jgi:hypothetical protein